MEPIISFGIQFTMSLWRMRDCFLYVAPRLSKLSREAALVHYLVHAFACRRDIWPCAVDAGVPWIPRETDMVSWQQPPRPAGTIALRPASRGDCVGLVCITVNAGYRERDHSINARQCVHICAWL